jgi:pyridoxal/pyridoxine/pyridoxamine kinase
MLCAQAKLLTPNQFELLLLQLLRLLCQSAETAHASYTPQLS